MYSATSRVGGFTQNLPAQPAGSYLVAYSAQFVGAAGEPGQPQHRDLPHHPVSAVSGTTVTTKAVLAETQVTSVESPPAVSGVGTARARRR